MTNDPELDGKYLGTISKDFAVVSETLKEASYEIRKREFEFPIFIMAKQEVPIGAMLIAKQELALDWDFRASYLEEFMQRGLIGKDRAPDFAAAYKNPDEFACIFVIDGAFTRFVFIPFPVD
ncbi:MAG TPA: hypothetical protein DCE41_24625 [Cytophagales bacterium]|nr:hypothetical protein [Cytophagales bacterium]HAA20081.1 hypothetical protein [Cytophagales bacterium]HAP62283.1 hypothetical protein [Cytophagales bacterium]